MPDLVHSLREQDLQHIVNIAELWGAELFAPDQKTALVEIAEHIINSELVMEIFSSLAADTQQAISRLLTADGRLPWQQFTRQFGEIRSMGSGRRSRQLPHRNPSSISEILWYRGFIARAFFETSQGLQEFAYIPDDLLVLLPQPEVDSTRVMGRAALKEERADTILASDHIVDHSCTLLAALRIDSSSSIIPSFCSDWGIEMQFLISLLTSAEIIDANNSPIPEATKNLLESDRGTAMLQLLQAWVTSSKINDLRMLPSLISEGGWNNDPVEARSSLMAMLKNLPSNKWFSIQAFIVDIHQFNPDFQRPTGDYDSWYLKDVNTGEYLRGFEHWYAIEGALIRRLITGPLHWLGVVDLASPANENYPTAFRLSKFGLAYLQQSKPIKPKPEDRKLKVDSKSKILIPSYFPRAVRYQVARFCEPPISKKNIYEYRVTPASLSKAQEQGLSTNQLLVQLRNHSDDQLPPNFVKALGRWQQDGTQIHIENVVVLRVNSPQILKELQSSYAARFLGDSIGPTTVQIKPGAWQNVLDALTNLGYLGAADLDREE